MKRNKRLLFLCVLLLLSVFSGCAKQEKRRVESLNDLRQPGTRIGAVTGSTFDDYVKEQFPNAQIEYYVSVSDLSQQVRTGEIDAFPADGPTAQAINREMPELTWLEEKVSDDNYAYAFAKDERGQDLKSKMDVLLAELSADGTLDEITDAWLNDEREKQTADYQSLPGENGVLQVATEAQFEPFCYVRDNEYVGIDVDLITRFCERYGYRPVFNNMSFDAVIPSLGTRCDVGASGISVTPEREESVLLSAPYYRGGVLMVVRSGEDVEQGFFASLSESFEKTFLREQRWKLILKGIGVTLFISVASAVFGTVLGFLVCLVRRMKNPFLHGLTTCYVRLLQGMPILVFLMILFYLVFSGSGLPGEWVAIIAFSINFSAYACEIFRTGIDAVDAGQTEAALAIGYTKRQAFLKIVMPQATRQFLPVYKGEFISLVKTTSIVGYIAIEDLTKMSDLIRGRTYEAFFPLIVTAAIYFFLSWALSACLDAIKIKLEPKPGRKVPKGVTLP